MKSLIISILGAIVLLAAGCDTTSTTTIHIPLGGNQRAATPPPSDISTVYVAVYTMTNSVRVWEIDALTATKSASPSGYISVVVPSGRELYILLVALNNTKTTSYVGAGVYQGESNPAPESMVAINIIQDDTSGSGTWISNVVSNQVITVQWWNEWQWLSDPGLNNALTVMEMHVERGNSSSTNIEPTSWSRVHSESLDSFLNTSSQTFVDTLASPLVNGGDAVWYRMRIYFPAVGLYIPAGGADGTAFVPAPAR